MAATINYGIQVGLSQTCLGNNGLRKILASANTPPPSRKSLQKTSIIVMANVEKLNESNMSGGYNQLVDINCLRANKSSHAIHEQCDGMYNNPQYSGLARRCSSPRHKLCTPLVRMSSKSGRS